MIGFGLYLNEGDDPAEWRCLSRRDALRIAEEIRVLLGAGQVGQDSHLPAAADVNTSARYMFGRRDRGVEAAKLAGAVREVEASLSKRISRLEGEVADHSGHIQDLRSKSVEAEQSMGRLLSAVEGFCEQAAIRLETVTAPALASAAAAGVARAPIENRSLPEAPAITGAPSRIRCPSRTQAQMDAVPKPMGAEARCQCSNWMPSPKEATETHRRRHPPKPSSLDAHGCGRIAPGGCLARYDGGAVQGAGAGALVAIPIVIFVGVGTVVILLGILLWPTGSSPGGSNQVTSASEPVHNAPVTAPATPVRLQRRPRRRPPALRQPRRQPAAPGRHANRAGRLRAVLGLDSGRRRNHAVVGPDRAGQQPDRGYSGTRDSARRQCGRSDDSLEWEVPGSPGPARRGSRGGVQRRRVQAGSDP